MKNILEVLKVTVILTLICCLAAGGLALTNHLTADRIAAAAEKAEQQAMSRIIKAEDYKKDNITINGNEYNYYWAANGDMTLGFIITTSANGYGGPVKVMTGIDLNGNVVAIEVLDVSNETPGLGQNANNKNFWKRFIGKTEGVTAVKNSAGQNQVQAITGATITSRAVASAVNEAFDVFNAVKEGGQNG